MKNDENVKEIFLSKKSLPEEFSEREELLFSYFQAFLPTSNLVNDKEWQVLLERPYSWDYYVDPLLEKNTDDYGVSNASTVFKFNSVEENYFLCFNDCWTYYSWSLWYRLFCLYNEKPKRLKIIHADAHTDFMTSLLFSDTKNNLCSYWNNNPISCSNPNTIRDSILNGSVHIGNFFAPFLFEMSKLDIEVHVYHLVPKEVDIKIPDGPLYISKEKDSILCPGLSLLNIVSDTKVTREKECCFYKQVLDISEIELEKDDVTLLHLDMDYFNNRFDGDSNWLSRESIYNPSLSIVKRKIKDLFAKLEAKLDGNSIENTTIAFSPGFFPSELWKSSLETIDEAFSSFLTSKTHRLMRVESQVELVEGKGSKDKGGGKYGHYWHIFFKGKKAGKIFINRINEEPFGEHASIQIFLNKSSQNKGVGSIAYRMACENSQYNKVIAHMRKSNIASKKAAINAGFKEAVDFKLRQRAMIWER